MTGRTKRWALLALLLALLLPVGAQRSARAKSIGDRLWCMCGCKQILTQCNHVGCSVSTAMLKKLDTLVERGDSDELIIQAFVQEYGPQVQAQPPAEGLALMGYVLPGVALLAGLGLVFIVIRQWRRARGAVAAPATAPNFSADVLERARRQADLETDLDAGAAEAGRR